MVSRQDKDLELLNSILKDNSAKANNDLYAHYTDEIKNYIKRKYRLSIEDSEDLTADTLVKVLSSLTEYSDVKSTFRTWVLTIAEHTAINHNNKLSNRVEHFVYNHIEDIEKQNFVEIPCQDNFEEKFATDNTLNYLTSDLDQQSKRMIKMKYVEGYSHNEIGEVYSLTSTTVSNKINYTKNKLNKKLRNQ